VKNTSFIVITYDPSFNAFLMLTIDLFLTIVSPVVTENSVRAENAVVPSIREILVVSR